MKRLLCLLGFGRHTGKILFSCDSLIHGLFSRTVSVNRVNFNELVRLALVCFTGIGREALLLNGECRQCADFAGILSVVFSDDVHMSLLPLVSWSSSPTCLIRSSSPL